MAITGLTIQLSQATPQGLFTHRVTARSIYRLLDSGLQQ